MTDFTITEDFPKNEIEFDKRFSKPEACYDYLFVFHSLDLAVICKVPVIFRV